MTCHSTSTTGSHRPSCFKQIQRILSLEVRLMQRSDHRKRNNDLKCAEVFDPAVIIDRQNGCG